MITAANGIFSDIKTRTAYDADTKVAQPLSGNSMVRSISDSLLSAAAAGQTGFGSFKGLGVELAKDGTLSFDRAAFLTAYAADPAKVQAAIFTAGTPAAVGPPPVAATAATGLAATMQAAASIGDKNITAAVTSGNDLVKDLNDQIDNWDLRLATHKTALQLQYTNLETSLSKLKNQSSWLAGQLSALSTGSSN
jgi:flagellar hook-associated protein 2